MGTWTYHVLGRPPIEDAYASFANLINYGGLLRGIESITPLDDRSLRWAVATPGGGHQEWVLVMEEQVPNVRIAWQSVDQNPTSVEFTFEQPESDLINVTVLIQYDGPDEIERDQDRSIILNPWPH